MIALHRRGWVAFSPLKQDARADVLLERIREGGGEENPITASIEGDPGTVVVAPGENGLQFPVERVKDTWLVSNGTPLLFGYGVDPVS